MGCRGAEMSPTFEIVHRQRIGASSGVGRWICHPLFNFVCRRNPGTQNGSRKSMVRVVWTICHLPPGDWKGKLCVLLQTDWVQKGILPLKWGHHFVRGLKSRKLTRGVRRKRVCVVLEIMGDCRISSPLRIKQWQKLALIRFELFRVFFYEKWLVSFFKVLRDHNPGVPKSFSINVPRNSFSPTNRKLCPFKRKLCRRPSHAKWYRRTTHSNALLMQRVEGLAAPPLC